MRVSRCVLCVVVCLQAIGGVAQDTTDPSQALARVSNELKETRSELAEDRRLIDELRQKLDALTHLVQEGTVSKAENPPSAEPSVASADQDTSFLAAKVAELHQDKVESVSKYPVKLSGLILFNSFMTNGSVDVQDIPSLAFPKPPGSPNGSLGAALSQTMLGVTANGPKLLGGRTSADLEVDFSGGSPAIEYGVTTGLLRLRTANVHLDWQNTSLKIGQDSLFFSPLSPTSYATVAQPALSWSGNLWVWTPQIEIEHRFHLNSLSSLVLQGGLLDALTEEEPPFQGRDPTAGEQSRQPAMAGRIGFDRSSSRFPISLGFGGYRARQLYQSSPKLTSWTVNSDFKVALGSQFEISGEWYNGQAAGGLGGGIWTSVAYSEPGDPHSSVHALRSTGAWAQLKWLPATRFEVNGAIGQDENYGNSLRFAPVPYSDYGFVILKKNRAAFVNFVYKPNSFLLFATEYRRLFTEPAVGESASGSQVNVAAGVRF
jgi:hypothetical protein